MQGTPEPKSKLGYYRLLSPTAAVRVSPLWMVKVLVKFFVGETNKDKVFEVLDYYYDHGVSIFFNM
jgi:hypothetical protein